MTLSKYSNNIVELATLARITQPIKHSAVVTLAEQLIFSIRLADTLKKRRK